MDELIKCDICGEYEGTNQQVAVHRRHCERKQQENAVRKDRVPFGERQQKLHAPRDEEAQKFHFRVFNDNWRKDPARIQRAKAAGYTLVEGYETPFNVGTNDDGSPIRGVLMKIPKEWYKEDQDKKRQELDRIDAAIKGGTLEQQQGDKRYVPDGIKIHANSKET